MSHPPWADPSMRPLVAVNPADWVLPDFYTAKPDGYFEAALAQHLQAQGRPAPMQPAKKKTSRRKIDLTPEGDNVPTSTTGEPDFVIGTRRQLYGYATYNPGFTLPVTYKNQPIAARFIPGHIWGQDLAGPRSAKIMVVGKMPGRDEAKSGRNFIGPSGKFLKDQLTNLGVDPSGWYITNLVKFVPPDNLSGALPKPWISACRALLEIELAIVKPDFILCLGSEASKEMLGVTVDKAYGSVFDYRYQTDPTDPNSFKTAKAVVAIHPAAILRKSDRINQFQLSLRQFCDLTKGESPTLRESDLHHFVIRNEQELSALVDSILSGKTDMVSVDAEWHGRRPQEPGAFLRCFQFSWKHKHAAVVALTKPGGEKCFEGNPFLHFARLFNGPNPPRLVGHNIKADLMWLRGLLLPYGVNLEQLAMPPELGDIDGPPATRTIGGFDTMLAAHAVKETGQYGLKDLGVLYLGVPRYDNDVDLQLGAGVSHGFMPDEILYPYALLDADVTYRLAKLFNGTWRGPLDHDCVKVGYLDQDPAFGVNSRKHFWISMMASNSFLEMEETGIVFDTKACSDLRVEFSAARERVLAELRNEICWPDFNPNSINHKRELLFGEALNGKKLDNAGKAVKIRPEGALSLMLDPLKATGKQAMPWTRIVQEGLTSSYSPSTAKDTLGIYAHKLPIVKKLMDLSFVTQALNTALREPSAGTYLAPIEVDDTSSAEGEEGDSEATSVRQRGLLDYICCDGAIHSIYSQTKETGRASSFKPNLMAISKRRDKDYKRIIGPGFRPIRSLFVARPGRVLIEADFVGAELAVMAWLSGDKNMMDHVRRSGLPESHPDHFDIHSSFAVEIFRLDLPPIKSVLEAAGKKAYRDAVKTIVFGIPYGRGTDAVIMAVKEESGINLTKDEAEKIKNSIFARYPNLLPLLERTRNRVVSPGFLRDAWGGIRRLQIVADDRKNVEDAKREAGNFRIQGTVARAMSMGLYYLKKYRTDIEPQLDYLLVNQIHDAAISECAVKDAYRYVKHVLPVCLTEAIQFRPVDDDGRLVSDAICKFDLDIHVYERWGQDLTHEDCDRLGLPREFGKALKK